MSEQYSRRNNIELAGILNLVKDNVLEETIMNSCKEHRIDIIAITKTRIRKDVTITSNLLNNYFMEFTRTESPVGDTLLYIANLLSYKSRNDLNRNLS